MSLKQMAAAWQTKTANHTQKLVLLALADNANDGGECWPSITNIAARCELCRQAVVNQIGAMERAGIVRIERHHGKVNRYILVIEPVYEVDQSTALTSPPHRLPPVYGVDYHPSTTLTTPVYGVDTNRKEPSLEPSLNRHKARKRATPHIDLPLPFESEGFRQTWADWQQARREQRKPLTPTAAKAQLAMLAKQDEQTAIAMLQQSIQNGYQGIFPLKTQRQQPTKPIRPCDESDVDWRNMKEL